METLIRDKVFMIDNFFSEKECKEYISWIQVREKNNQQKRNFAVGANFFNEGLLDVKVSQQLFERFETFNKKELHVKKACDYVTIAHYKKDEDFGIHTDTGIYENGLETKFVLLIYLNTVNNGGETEFFSDGDPVYGKSAGTSILKVKPVFGRCVIFDIDMLHRANVTSHDKWWIGTDLMG